MNLPDLLAKARHSSFSRWWLNVVLPFIIPFNRPHGFKVIPLPGGGIAVRVPYWRVNRNHIKGIHACALATASEMCSGLSLLEHLDARRYRLIMRTMHVAYHYQAKKLAEARCVPAASEIAERVIGPLATQDSVDHASTVQVRDTDGVHLATATITWQVKAWDKVRTKG